MDRDNNGRFVKGISGNPHGRPSRPKEEQYYRILMTTCTDKDWRAIIDKAIAQAKHGDAVARKWLADYLIGAPVQRQEITGLEGSALEIIVTYENKPPVTETA